MKTLKEFLEKNGACKDGFDFAKDLTLEQFLKTCQRGDWILWLFARINPSSLLELTLAKAHCANTVRHLMKDARSIKAVDVAIAFGEGRATREELDAAFASASNAANAAYDYATSNAAYVAYAAYAASFAANVANVAYAYATYAASNASNAAAYAAEELIAPAYANVANAAYFANVARVENRKQTADICRKYLPLEIWNNN